MLTLIVASAGCGEGSEATITTQMLIAPVIYGEDDRGRATASWCAPTTAAPIPG